MRRLTALVFLIFAFKLAAESPDCTTLSLQDAESYALKNNFSVKAAAYLAQAGRYELYDAISKWLPKVDFQLTAENTNQGITFGRSKVNNWTVNFEENIFSTDVIFNARISAAEAKRLCYELVTIMNQVLFDTRTAYYQLILAQEIEQVQLDNIKFLDQEFNRDYERFTYGESTAFDVNQSQTTVANSFTNYYAALQNVEEARNALLEVMGYYPSTECCIETEEKILPVFGIEMLSEKIKGIENSPSLIKLPKSGESEGGSITLKVAGKEVRTFTTKEVDRWTEIAVRRRPEIISQHYEVKRREAEVSRAKGEYAPDIRLFGRYADQRTDGIILDHRKFWGGGVSVNWLLFDSFGRRNRIQGAKSTLCASLQNYYLRVQETRHLISNTFYELDQFLRTYVSTKQAVQLAEESLQYATESRELGEISPIQYREAVANLTRARQDFHSSEFALIRAYYNLERVAGIALCK